MDGLPPPCHLVVVTKNLIGKPILSDKLDAELGSKVVKLVKADMERAARQRRQAAEEQPTPAPEQQKKAT